MHRELFHTKPKFPHILIVFVNHYTTISEEQTNRVKRKVSMDSSTVSKDEHQYVQEEVYEKVPHMAIRLLYLRVRNCSALLSSSHENFFQPFFIIIFCTCLSVLHLHCVYVSTGYVKAYLILSLPCFSHQSNYNFVQMLHDTILHTSITFPLALSFLVMLV